MDFGKCDRLQRRNKYIILYLEMIMARRVIFHRKRHFGPLAEVAAIITITSGKVSIYYTIKSVRLWGQ